MARHTLTLPREFDFSTTLTVRITDINYGGHLGNDSLLSLLQEARVRFLARYGYSEKDIEGCGIAMTDAEVIYAGEAFAGDRLRIAVAACDPTRIGCDFYYQALRESDGREIARARTGLVFFDYNRRKPMRAPEAFKTICVSAG